MKYMHRLLLYLALIVPAGAQTLTSQNLAQILGFENGTSGTFPAGWYGTADGTVVTDCQVAHGGKCSARFARTSSSSGTFSSLYAAIPIDFPGQTLQWSGWVKTENVSDYAAIYFGEWDSHGNNLGFATTQFLPVQGTTDWTQYSVTLSLNSTASQLRIGALLDGTGASWVDDLQLLVDGQPVAEAPTLSAGFTSDHQFDTGSGIGITSLSDIQVQNLATLAKVWGFLKYHHPGVTSGQHRWDYDLFRALPAVLAAGDGPAANQAIAAWIASRLGSAVDPCNPCATLDTSGLYMGANLDWLSDVSLLGSSLSQTLQAIYANRTLAAQTFFVSLASDVGNPMFQDESDYPSLTLPDSGYQLLGLFRFWNMVQYFYPDRDVMADAPAGSPNYWDDVLRQSIPGIALAKSSLQYQQQLLLFVARVHDTHANLWSSLAARPPMGNCQLPVQLRFVEGVPVVAGFLSPTAGPASGLQVGDVIQQLDGTAVADLVAQWTPYYADSNQAARLRDIGNAMTQGVCGAASVSVLRGQQQLSLTPVRVPTSTLNLSSNWDHSLPGNTFQMLSKDVAYLKLSSVVAAQSANYIESAAGSRGLIIDIRNYPSEFVVFTLGDLLVPQPVDFAQFTYGDVTNPGAFHWQSPPLGLTPAQPRYAGKVVILVDEITQSQAEYTALAFRTAPGAIVVGSTTAGADGNVSTVPLPGGLSSLFSGIGVFYPDRRPTQRVGIIPDIRVTPTIQGIRAGRDEVLEMAIRQIERRTARKPIFREP